MKKHMNEAEAEAAKECISRHTHQLEKTIADIRDREAEQIAALQAGLERDIACARRCSAIAVEAVCLSLCGPLLTYLLSANSPSSHQLSCSPSVMPPYSFDQPLLLATTDTCIPLTPLHTVCSG